MRLDQMIKQVARMRLAIIRASIKNFYLVSNVDLDIDRLSSSLSKVEEAVLNWLQTSQNPESKNGSLEELNSVIDPELLQVSSSFTSIFSYIAGGKEEIFPRFYQKECNRKIIRL